MTLDAIAEAASRDALEVLGLCHTTENDGLGHGTLVLLGPREPGFWAHVQAEPEFRDGLPDPMDRWSTRVVTRIADRFDARALFPFGTPPRPFIGWALRSGRAWVSPPGLLVHDVAGLLVSYRGALLLAEKLTHDDPGKRPCDTCDDKPCLAACPAGALNAHGYDLGACHAFLDTPDGAACMSDGCHVRRACPVSRSYARDPAQSAFHMAAFHPRR